MDQPAAAVYSAKLVKVSGDFLPWAVLTAIFGWWPWMADADLPDPRYRVVVGRHGSDNVVGVAMARRHRKGRRLLAEVEGSLATLDVQQFEQRYDLVGEGL